MAERGIPLAAMDRILKKAGADRVGEDAKSELKAVVEELTKRYGQRAIKFAEHAGRKTIKEEDVRLAMR